MYIYNRGDAASLDPLLPPAPSGPFRQLSQPGTPFSRERELFIDNFLV